MRADPPNARRSMPQPSYLPVYAATCVLVVMATDVLSAPFVTLDQKSQVGAALSGASSPDFLIGQSFIPSLNGIDAIELSASILAQPASMRIALLDGVVGVDGLGGAVLGLTRTVTITGTSVQKYHFDFPSTIPLTPGKSYVMRFEPLGPNSNPQIAISVNVFPPIDRYPRGQALQLNLPLDQLAQRDYVFVEGLHTVPEPSACVLWLAAVAV